MRFIILFMWFISLGWSCSGDCLSCHPSLSENILSDERHKPMLSCKACHKNEEAGISTCGKDCFACHDIAKIDKNIKEHEVIDLCRQCHMNSMPVKLESQPKTSTDSGSMYDLLFAPK